MVTSITAASYERRRSASLDEQLSLIAPERSDVERLDGAWALVVNERIDLHAETAAALLDWCAADNALFGAVVSLWVRRKDLTTVVASALWSLCAAREPSDGSFIDDMLVLCRNPALPEETALLIVETSELGGSFLPVVASHSGLSQRVQDAILDSGSVRAVRRLKSMSVGTANRVLDEFDRRVAVTPVRSDALLFANVARVADLDAALVTRLFSEFSIAPTNFPLNPNFGFSVGYPAGLMLPLFEEECRALCVSGAVDWVTFSRLGETWSGSTGELLTAARALGPDR